MALSDSGVRDRLCGVTAGLLTPFDRDSSVDHQKLQSNARALYERGIRSFLAVANISEYHSLSNAERIDVAASSVEAVPSDGCVLAGVGGSTGDALELVRAYDDVGVDGMMIMPPDHTFVHERGLLEYYAALGQETARPLVPYVRDFEPSVDFLVDLTALDGVAGIKYAVPDTTKLGAAVEPGDDDVVWVNGLAEPYAVSTWAEGCDGFTAGVSNFRPEVGLALYEALRAENWERARRLRNACLPYQRFRGEAGENNSIPGALSVPAVKKGLELAGFYGGECREPIRPLQPAEERRAEELYRRLDEDVDRLLAAD